VFIVAHEGPQAIQLGSPDPEAFHQHSFQLVGMLGGFPQPAQNGDKIAYPAPEES